MKPKGDSFEPVTVKNGKWEKWFRKEWTEATELLKKEFPEQIEKIVLVKADD